MKNAILTGLGVGVGTYIYSVIAHGFGLDAVYRAAFVGAFVFGAFALASAIRGRRSSSAKAPQ
jgi:hypothetical protein